MKIPTLLTVLGTAFALPAQCLFTSVTTQSVGPSCNTASTGMCAIVALPTFVESSLDVPNCALDVQIVVFEGCGATVPLRALAIGFQPAFVPLPEFGPACALHLLPIAFLPTGAGPTALALPPGVQTFGFLLQAVALSVPPLAGEPRLTFSEGLAVSLQ